MKIMTRLTAICFAGIAALSIAGCFQIKTENEIKPIEVKPIHITVDINVKIDRALDDFFGDLDKAETSEKTENGKKTQRINLRCQYE